MSIPVVFICVLIELTILWYPNSFNLKAKHLNSNTAKIECLFLGSSHTQNAINPKLINIKSANLAYGSQDYQLDNALFFQYVDRLESLEKLFIEVDYHSLEKKNTADYFRLQWYYKYYDINLGDFNAIDKLSLFVSNKSFFKNYLINKLNPFNEKANINEYGFIENDSDIFEKMNFNEKSILKTAANRLKNNHTAQSIENFNFNRKKIVSVINYCLKNNIEVILLKNPMYLTYRDNYIKNKNDRRNTFVDSLLTNTKIKMLDFEADNRFTVNDYKNDDHLNSSGAKKIANFINASLDHLNR